MRMSHGEIDFVAEIPRVAVHHDDERFGAMGLRVAERVDASAPSRRRAARPSMPACDASTSMPREKLSPWPNRTSARSDGVVLVLVEHLGQPRPRRRIEPVLDKRPVEPDEHDVARRSTVIVTDGPSGTSASVVTGSAAAPAPAREPSRPPPTLRSL